MSSIPYTTAKQTGLAAGLSVPASDIIITGFALGARRLATAARQLTVSVSVTTSFKVVVADITTGNALASTIEGASASIEAHTQSAMNAADWDMESVIIIAPTMAALVAANPIVNALVVLYGIYGTGKCGGTGTDRLRTTSGLTVEECGDLCARTIDCAFFSFSTSKCKLTKTCDPIRVRRTEYTIYQMGWTLAPTFAPGVPTPAPTSVLYSVYREQKKCKGSWVRDKSGLTVEECASLCRQITGCAFFSHSSQLCKLSKTCDRLNKNFMNGKVYQMDGQ